MQPIVYYHAEFSMWVQYKFLKNFTKDILSFFFPFHEMNDIFYHLKPLSKISLVRSDFVSRMKWNPDIRKLWRECNSSVFIYFFVVADKNLWDFVWDLPEFLSTRGTTCLEQHIHMVGPQIKKIMVIIRMTDSNWKNTNRYLCGIWNCSHAIWDNKQYTLMTMLSVAGTYKNQIFKCTKTHT
jgi:hypothetical protein